MPLALALAAVHDWQPSCQWKGFKNPPVSGAFEPVEDVGAAGVVNLVKRVSVRLLNGDGITAKKIIDYFFLKTTRIPETPVRLLINHKR